MNRGHLRETLDASFFFDSMFPTTMRRTYHIRSRWTKTGKLVSLPSSDLPEPDRERPDTCA